MTNQDYINQLHPRVRHFGEQAIEEANKRLTGRAKVQINFAYRSSEQQAAIYAQGRTIPGNIVTDAKPGQSYHEYGLALDIDLLIDGKRASWDTVTDWDGDKQSDWMEVVSAFKMFGWAWGGDWIRLGKGKIVDMPHFDMHFGIHWSKLQLLPKDENGYVKLP